MHASFRDAVRAGAAVPREGSYRFFHDRVQEAAYALIPPEGRAELHLRIARLLVAETEQERIADKIYGLVNQLNLGSALISEWPEKLRAAELNFVAGRKAKTSTAYASASNYLAAGIAILSDEGWQRSYDLMLGLFLERAECEILKSNLEQAAGLVEALLIKAQSKIDQAEICRLSMLLQLRQGNYAPAVHTALECLRTFGVDLPNSPTPEQMRAEYEEMRRTLGDRPIESLVDLPMMNDPEIRAVMKLFSALGELAYHADGDLFQMISCWMVKLTCRHGTSEYSAIGYGAIAVVLGPAFHRFADGEAFARLAVAIAERHEFSAQKAGAHFLMQMAVLWTRPIEDALTCLEAAIRSVGETGEMVYACFNRQHRLTDLMARGDPLDQVWLESAGALDFVRKYKFGQLVILSIQGFVQNLRGGVGSDAPLDEAALEARVLRGGVPLVACFHWILQLQKHVLLGNAERALEFAAKAKPILWSARLNLQSMDYCFYHSLAIAAVFEAASPERRAKLREDLIEHLARFQKWAESCPATFAHKHALISAEWARLEGRDTEAMQLYEQAIRSAAERGFLQDRALAGELAARFYRLRGLDKVADTYLDEARDCYARWGAKAKVAQLDQRHPRVRQQIPLVLKPTIEAPVEQFDLATVIKMSEAVAGEIVLEKLIETLMVTAVEHAGADRGLLLLPRGSRYRIEAGATSGRDGVKVHLVETPATPSELPLLILEQVIRTKSEVILDDARGRNMFAEDEYMSRKRVRSLLCLPLLKQADLIGVLYLENSLASHVFTPARIAVLKLLASQAAIALENARLYRDVADREAEARESEQRYREVQLELAHANRVATMGQLTASITHEVNQPITAAVTYALAARRFLSAEPPNFHEADDALSLIVKEGNRAGEVVGRVRALIKKAPARRDAVAINEAILEVIALTRTEAANNGVSVRTQLAEGLPRVQGDRVQLQQVLLNLIINAIEAMRDVGEGERELLISSHNEPDGVSVEVRDSGPGFAPADIDRVFEAFYSTKPSGMGLGLSICRSIVEAHNGRLWASPNLPRGAIFRFIAPAHPAAVS
jgi:signal transduction histidine kinase